MKKLLISFILLTTMLIAKAIAINKGTEYETTLVAKNKVFYLNHKGKREKLFEGWIGAGDEPSMDLEFQIDDIKR